MHARNLALSRARGQYVAFQNSDDIWVPAKLAAQLEVMEGANRYIACFTAAEIVDASGRPTTGLPGDSLPGKVQISVRQSDEGGRFFRDIAQYRIIDVGEAQPTADGIIWLTLAEVTRLLPQGIFNNEARSALSLLLSLA